MATTIGQWPTGCRVSWGGVASGLVVLAFGLAIRATGKQMLHGVVSRENIEKFTLDRL